jgi:hypothetical protein
MTLAGIVFMVVGVGLLANKTYEPGLLAVVVGASLVLVAQLKS